MFDPYRNTELDQFANQQVSAFALELLPRTLSRAQNMDVLSSQANLAGYKSVLLAAAEYQRMFPMLMTAAGTVKPARVVIMGVGVVYFKRLLLQNVWVQLLKQLTCVQRQKIRLSL